MSDSLVLGAAAEARRAGLPKWTLAGLFLLAGVSDANSREVEMSVSELADWLRISTDTGKRITRELVRSGFLEIVRPGRGTRPNRYRVNVAPLTRGSEADPCK